MMHHTQEEIDMVGSEKKEKSKLHLQQEELNEYNK